MGMIKLLLILCTIVLVTLCDETESQQSNFATKVINNHCKRQFEKDSVISKPKLLQNPIKKSKILRIKPVSKNLNPLLTTSRNILPRGQIVPNIPTFQKLILPANDTEVKNVNNDETKETNEINATDDVENEIPTQNDKTNKNEHDDYKKTDDEEENKDQATRKKNDTMILDKEITDLSPKEMKKSVTNNSGIDGSRTQNAETKNPVLSEVNKFSYPPAILLPNFMGYHKIPANPINLIKEISEDTKTDLNNTDNKVDTIDNDSDYPLKMDSKNCQTISDIKTKINPLSFIARTEKLQPNINNLQTPIIISTIKQVNKTNDSLDSEDVKKVEIKKEPDVDFSRNKCLEIEPNEELLIQNNNYEEMFESSVPQYLYPKLINSELRLTQNHNYIPSPYYKYNAPTNYDEKANKNYNKPYSYDIEQYPDKYVINTYDDMGAKDNLNEIVTNANRCYQDQYNQYFRPNFGQLNSYRQNSNRIWRSWRNNQITIRPKSTITVNLADLYANRYVRRNLQFNNNGVGFTSVENHNNESPYLYQTPLQFRSRNGY